MSPRAVTATFEALKADTLTKWRRWAAEIAAGGDLPAPVDVLEAGAVLEIPGPMQALDDDAAALREVNQLAARAVAVKAQLDAPLQDAGGADAVRERLAELRAEVGRLERLVGGFHYSGWSAVLQEKRKIERAHPRVFPETVEPAAKPVNTKKRKEVA